MFIDIHGHTRRGPMLQRLNGKPAYTTPQQLLARYDAVGIERAVMLPGVSPECTVMPQSNEEILEIAAECDRFIPFCNVDPRALTNSADAPLDHLMGYYRDRGCKGIGEVTANLPVDDPRVQNFFAHAASVGLPVTIHMAHRIGGLYGLYDDPGLPRLERTLRRFPDLKIFGHSQTFWAEIGTLDTVADRDGYPAYAIRAEGAVPKLMRRYPNLYGDLSANSGCNALARDEDYAAGFLDEFQDRLFFGTDISMPDVPTPLVNLLTRFRDKGRISETVFRKVARENAIRVLELR